MLRPAPPNEPQPQRLTPHLPLLLSSSAGCKVSPSSDLLSLSASSSLWLLEIKYQTGTRRDKARWMKAACGDEGVKGRGCNGGQCSSVEWQASRASTLSDLTSSLRRLGKYLGWTEIPGLGRDWLLNIKKKQNRVQTECRRLLDRWLQVKSRDAVRWLGFSVSEGENGKDRRMRVGVDVRVDVVDVGAN